MSPAFPQAPGDLGHADLVARLRRADEIVERDVEVRPGLAELALHLVAVGQRIEPLVDRLLEHVLRVLVVPHQEARLEAAEPLVARDDVGADLLVRRAQVRAAVHVVDGGGQKETVHGRYAFIASAWTSFTGRLCAAASFAQSSNSGVAFSTCPSRDATLTRTVPIDVSTGTRCPLQALAVHVVVPQPDRRRLAEDDVGHRRAQRRRRDDGQQRARAILLHLHRDVEHLERAGGVEPIHDEPENLRVHVVDLAFDDGDAIAGCHGRPKPALDRGRAGLQGCRLFADQHAQHVRRHRIVAIAGAVADALDRHRRDRAERRSVGRGDQRAGRRHQLLLHLRRCRPARRRAASPSPAPAPETRRAPSSPSRRRHSAASRRSGRRRPTPSRTPCRRCR